MLLKKNCLLRKVLRKITNSEDHKNLIIDDKILGAHNRYSDILPFDRTSVKLNISK